jgi:hypothetical protein
LYTSGRLEGVASDWWDAYTVAHAAADTITWQEFQESFRTHHIPAGVKKLKQKEFLALKQGNMIVSEYLDDEMNWISAEGNPSLCTSVVVPGGYHVQSLSQRCQNPYRDKTK